MSLFDRLAPARSATLSVAWVTHHVGAGNPAAGWLPGPHRGGGEMTDADWRAGAPRNVSVRVVPPERWWEALSADRIVVTGTDLLSDEAMVVLSERAPMVALHHRQPRSEARRELIEAACPLVLHTPAHVAVESEWCRLPETQLVLSPMHPDDFGSPVNDRDVALWAARDHPLKGREQAAAFAAENGWRFEPIVGQPRPVVLEAMRRARRFVHLPLEFESEGRAVIEAVLSGCEVHVNDNVGVSSFPLWRDPVWLREMTFSAAGRFWGLVCGSQY